MAVSGAVSYCVVDPKKAILDVQEVDVSLPALSLGIIAHYVTTHTLEECLSCDELVACVRDGIVGQAAERWGLSIMRVWLTDIAEHTVIRVIGGSETNGIMLAEGGAE